MSGTAQPLLSKKRKRSVTASVDLSKETARSSVERFSDRAIGIGDSVALYTTVNATPPHANDNVSRQTPLLATPRNTGLIANGPLVGKPAARAQRSEQQALHHPPQTDQGISGPNVHVTESPMEHQQPPDGGVYVNPSRPLSLRPADSHIDTNQTRWKADPNKLHPGKKGKFYGVRAGRSIGIFYDWNDVREQVEGFPNAIHQAFKTQAEVEDYMNHQPEDCEYRSCASLCKGGHTARINRESSTNNQRQFAGTSANPHHYTSDVNWPTSAQSQMLYSPAQEVSIQYNPIHASAMPLTPLSQDSTDSQSSTGIGNGIPSRQICICGRSAEKLESNEVSCANADCKVKTFHVECVGLASRLANRTLDPTWRCRACRNALPPLPQLRRVVNSHAGSGSAEPRHLSSEQRAVVDLILEGSRNVCYTGRAGAGKSTVLKAVVRALRNKGRIVDIVAPSGIAALGVGGQTTFSYLGCTPDHFKMPLEKFVQCARGKKVRKRLRATDVLIIEEISMVDSQFFQRLDLSCREARFKDRWYTGPGLGIHEPKLPFGGIQVIVTGDFCQLPPVKPFKFCLYCGGNELPGHPGNRSRALTCPRCKKVYEDDDKWAFRNTAWESCNFHCVTLTEIHRQTDRVFTNILQKCREGQPLSQGDKHLLLSNEPNMTNAVQLRPTTAEVFDVNRVAFRDLPGPVYAYECHDQFAWKKDLHPELEDKAKRIFDGRWQGRTDGPLKANRDHRLEEYLELKIGTLVILVANIDMEAGMVNGAQGRVIGFQTYSPNGGAGPQTQPSAYLPGGREGEYGEAQYRRVLDYVESRCPRAWPVVEFNNGTTQIIYPHCQLSELGAEEPYSLLSRTQIPLIQAWAITIHKSQGMTLQRVEVDLSRAFEHEMIYVALSRCTGLDGLKVHSLPKDKSYGPNLVVQEFLERFKPASKLLRAACVRPAIKVEAGNANYPITSETCEAATTKLEAWNVKETPSLETRAPPILKVEVGNAKNPICLE